MTRAKRKVDFDARSILAIYLEENFVADFSNNEQSEAIGIDRHRLGHYLTMVSTNTT